MGIIVKCNNKHCIVKVCELERFACPQQYTSMNNSNSEYNYVKYVKFMNYLQQYVHTSCGVGRQLNVKRCGSCRHTPGFLCTS